LFDPTPICATYSQGDAIFDDYRRAIVDLQAAGEVREPECYVESLLRLRIYDRAR
jgi:hypothetical protein